MRELQDIVRAYEILAREGAEAVLATVVQTRGSTYRKAGARMLMTESEWLAGAISGGCLEGDLLRKAWWRTAQEHAVLITYDAAREEDDSDPAASDQPVRWGFGLGCDGSIDVLLERLRPAAALQPLRLLGSALRTRRRAVISTVVRVWGAATGQAQVGQRAMVVDGEAAVTDLGAPLAAQVGAQCAQLLTERTDSDEPQTVIARHAAADGGIEVAHEFIPPPHQLVVFGGNYDALPVLRFAHALGWDVTLIERRPTVAVSSAQFAQHARVVIGRAPEVTSRLLLTARTSAVVMTHNYEEDRAIVQSLITSPVRYIGMLGPARRTERILGEIAAVSHPLTPATRARIRGPVGLDLGARAPEEIALAIIAEVQAATGNRSARPLSALLPAPTSTPSDQKPPRD